VVAIKFDAMKKVIYTAGNDQSIRASGPDGAGSGGRGL